MEPIVNGLEQTYANQVDFRRLDANSEQGNQPFEYFSLFGHPSYVLLNPQGEVLWKSVGELSTKTLEDQILAALK